MPKAAQAGTAPPTPSDSQSWGRRWPRLQLRTGAPVPASEALPGRCSTAALAGTEAERVHTSCSPVHAAPRRSSNARSTDRAGRREEVVLFVFGWKRL